MAHEVQNLPAGCFLLSMTQGHSTDLPVLKAAFERAASLALIGVIGSDVKAKKIKTELQEQGVSADLVSRLACPLGLPIGNNTPPEIAVSICAQLLTVRDGR